MFVYWSMFAFPALFALVTGPRTNLRNTLNTMGLVFVFLLFAITVGLRYQVGADWFTYEQIVAYTAYEDFFDALLTGDPGFSFVAWSMARLGFEVWGPNLVCGTILVAGLIHFCRKQDDMWLALTASVPYLMIVVGMGYVRQAAAIGFILFALDRFERGSFARSVGLIVAASLFHASAVCVAPLFAMAVARKRIWLIVPLGFATIGLFALLLQSRVDTLYEAYVVAEYDSSGAFIRLLMNAVPSVLYLYYRKRFPGTGWSRALWMLFSVLSLIMVVAVTVSSSTTLIDRIGLYFIPIQLYVFGNLMVSLHASEKTRFMMTALTVGYYSAILFVWLNYATHADFWLPYRFAPLEAEY